MIAYVAERSDLEFRSGAVLREHEPIWTFPQVPLKRRSDTEPTPGICKQGQRFQLLFAGQSAQSTATIDQVNLVMFRNASNGSAIATTYWWSSGNRIVDADIVFWDGAFRFFAGTTGCSGGFYIEDIAAHEFGHVLGLGHSASSDATMYYATSSCNTGNRSLHPDDIAGVRALYPPAPGPPPGPPSSPTGLRFTY